MGFAFNRLSAAVSQDPGCKVTLLQIDERIAPADQVQSAGLDHGGHDVLPTAHLTHSHHLLAHGMFQDSSLNSFEC